MPTELISFNDCGITITGYIKDNEFYIGSGSGNIQCIDRSYNGSIYVPSYCNINNKRYPITTITSYSFYKTKITHVTLPSSINSILGGAFESCHYLEYVDLSQTSCKIIVMYTFSCAYKLRNVLLPKTITTIRDHAFYFTALQSILIYGKVKDIHTDAFLKTPLTVIYCGKKDIASPLASDVVNVYVPESYPYDTFGGKTVIKKQLECIIDKCPSVYCKKSTHFILYAIFLLNK